jgi:hypothetical protein
MIEHIVELVEARASELSTDTGGPAKVAAE